MGMMKKTFISGAVLACSLQASVANAACVPPVGPVSSLLPPAELLITAIDTAFEAHETTVSTALKSAFGNIQSAVSDVNMKIAQDVLQANHAIMKNNLEMQRLSSDLKMKHQAYLQQVAAKEEAALLTTSASSAGKNVNHDYFARLCSLKKTSDAAFSPQGRGKSLNMTRNTIGGYEFSAKGALLSFQQRDIVKAHYSTFCTDTDVEQQLCEEVAKIPNADLLAFVFLRPQNEEGKGVIKDISLKTEYTYSDYELSAAKAYIAHVVPLHTLKKPALGNETSYSAVPYTARFNQLTAMNNLARYAFSNAYNNRVPVVDSGNVRLSRLDQIRVMIARAKTTDMQSVTNSNAKGKMVFNLNQMAIENMLDQEIAALEKLNNDLLAAMLAEENNTTSAVRNLNSMRK